MPRRTHTTSSHWGAFDVTSDGKAIESVRPFEADRSPSPIIDVTAKAIHHATRVRRPAIRKSWLEGDRRRRCEQGHDLFVDLPWDEALDIAATEIARVRTAHGNTSIFAGSYGWASAGRFHHAQGQLKRFFNCAGGFVSGSGSYSAGASYIMIPHLFGVDHDEFTWSWQNTWHDIVAHCNTIMAFGGISPKNAQVNAGGTGDHRTAAHLAHFIDKGGALFTVSPHREDGPAQGTWLSLPPGTDVALMMGLAYVLETENLADRDFMARCTVGYDALRSYLLGSADEPAKTPAWAARECGIPERQIVELAHKLASGRTLITVAWALQRARHGEQTYWMATALAAMLGQIGLPGGGIGFGYGAVGGVGTDAALLPGPRFEQGENPVAESIPVARIADMLLHPGEAYEFNGATLTYPDIRLIYWAGGNPFHHHQDLHRLERAWAAPDTIIVNEPWWTSTALRADIVFPVTTSLEREDVGYDKTDPYLFHMPQVIEPCGEARDDHDVFRGLSAQLGVLDAFTLGRTKREWLEAIYEDFRQSCMQNGVSVPVLDSLRRQNWVKLDVEGRRGPSGFESFRADPDRYPLSTPSGRIELFSRTIADFRYDGLPGHPVWIPADEDNEDQTGFAFHLVSPQPADKLHSQFEAALADQDGARPVRVRIHPETADRLGIGNGELVELFNRRGTCLARAEHDIGIHRQVLSLPTGAWFSTDTQGRDRHGNPNVLTRDVGTSQLSQGSTAHTTRVAIRKATIEPI